MSWRMHGRHVKNCNCAFSCPCDFNAPPTYGPCEGMAAMQIDEGFFGETRLDGLRWACVYRWPGPLHEGNGTIQAVIDARADAAQRTALLTILAGREQVETTFFHIVSLIAPHVLKPLFLPIAFAFDLAGRRARVAVPSVFETTSEPIRNPVTGATHRARVGLPDGMEYREAEIASATLEGTGAIRFAHAGRHSSLALVTYTDQGLA